MRKRDLKSDADCLTLENAICLVFIETQFLETARKIEHGKMVEVVRKTLAKMTPAGREAALGLQLPEEAKALIGEALTA